MFVILLLFVCCTRKRLAHLSYMLFFCSVYRLLTGKCGSPLFEKGFYYLEK
ncbi:hypothetical protein HMPREF0973_00643 [Prevotella veroralis F0319]|uniref:Uncharacterized protein n=1 Tax=Prevotella veroralis F0319 TaxID=649761 RepID=C9MM15_9BACT|nr:hypothetical protein HMPREF0973_00643 [Prevotella veroralis F0319]